MSSVHLENIKFINKLGHVSFHQFKYEMYFDTTTDKLQSIDSDSDVVYFSN
jgi:hypothetical protein